MWLNTVDVFTPATHTCMPATPLPKQCAYGSAVAIGQRLFYVGGGNGNDWFSSMLRLSLNDPAAQWEQVSAAALCRLWRLPHPRIDHSFQCTPLTLCSALVRKWVMLAHALELCQDLVPSCAKTWHLSIHQQNNEANNLKQTSSSGSKLGSMAMWPSLTQGLLPVNCSWQTCMCKKSMRQRSFTPLFLAHSPGMGSKGVQSSSVHFPLSLCCLTDLKRGQ